VEDVFKAGGAFVVVLAIGVLWHQFSQNTGNDIQKELDEGRKQWERNPAYVTKPASPLDAVNGPGWTPPRPVPPAVSMPTAGKK
jgi:hypothetical protein